MPDRRPFLTLRTATLVGVGVAILLGIVFVVTGPAVTRDSRSYLDVAEDLVEGRGFSDPTFEDAAHFPPVTSIAVAAVSLTGLSGETSLAVVNTVAWAAAVLGAAALYRQAGGRSPGTALVLLVWVGAGGASTAMFSTALSEGVFVATSIWAVIVAERWARRASWSDGVLLWVLTAAAVGARYVGVALLAAFALRVLLQPDRRGRIVGALVPLAAIVPIGLWALAVRDQTGGDPAQIADRSFTAGTAFHSLGALGSWPFGFPYSEDDDIVAPALDDVIRGGLAVVGLVLVLATAWWLRSAWSRHGGLGGLVEVARERRWLTALLATGVSVAVLVAWRFLIGYHVLLRYWTPALLPAAVVVATAVSMRLEGADARWRSRAMAFGVALLGANAVLTAYQIAV